MSDIEESKISYVDESAFLGSVRRFYTPTEVSQHNCVGDCWVSIYGKVYAITSLLSTFDIEDPLIQPMIEFAGTDISDWFDKETTTVKRSLDPELQLILPLLPHGRFAHVAPAFPVANWSTAFAEPWWRDEDQYCIGRLSQKTRKVRLLNVLTQTETLVETCVEETVNEIKDRYAPHNAHCGSYTWKVLDGDVFTPLDMELTLEENNVPDESESCNKLNLGEEANIALIHLYFNDDLTHA